MCLITEDTFPKKVRCGKQGGNPRKGQIVSSWCWQRSTAGLVGWVVFMGGTSFCSGMMEGTPQLSAAAGPSQHTVHRLMFMEHCYNLIDI